MSWYRKMPRWGQFLVVLGVALICLAVFLIVYLCGTGALELRDLGKKTKLDPWPAYDAAYRLEQGETPPTEEEIAYYIATKLPDELHGGLRGMNGFGLTDVVVIGAAPDAAGDPLSPPYAGSRVIEETAAISVTVHLRLPEGMDWNCWEVMAALREGSDYPFENIRFAYGFASSNGVTGFFPEEGTAIVERETYDACLGGEE